MSLCVRDTSHESEQSCLCEESEQSCLCVLGIQAMRVSSHVYVC